jgi:hypothetical protein
LQRRRVVAELQFGHWTRQNSANILPIHSVHTGDCEMTGDNIAGIAVPAGERIMAHAQPGPCLFVHGRILSPVHESIFEDVGSYGLKGIPGEWRIFSAS